MKKLSILFLVTFVSCLQTNENDVQCTPTGNDLNPQCVVVVEGCEYFRINAYTSYTYVHKGNCTNPIHKCNCK